MNIIRLGISTCPNDTFAFSALLRGDVDQRGLEFDIQLLDIQELNDRLFAGVLDVAKTSFHAALRVAEQTIVLPSGSAIGFGVGPLLLASRKDTTPANEHQRTLCPGEHTTATLLFRMFYPDTTKIDQVVFSDIMPALCRGDADFGVCIHEGRFTWQDEGLTLVEDLGSRWEQETGSPLPLGGLVARRALSRDTIATVQQIVLDSLNMARANPQQALPTMRRYAQEFDDHILMQHVDLYVNQWTVDLGNVGTAALDEFSKRARDSDVIGEAAPGLEVFGQS